MKIPLVDLRAQHSSLAAEINAAIQRVLERTDFILGSEVAAFEEAFARYCGASHAVGVASGTSALGLALRAFKIGPGDEVITVANTFIATCFAISAVGAQPVLVDIDPRTYNLDTSILKRAITSRTRAIIPVHLYGQPVDMDPLLELARKRGLLVIEDACQAHGALYKGKRVGALGDAACFSFYPSKNLGCYGDGGMVVTLQAEVAETLRMLRDYGQKEKYRHLTMGWNSRLDTLQAAILGVKLKRLDEWNESRRSKAAAYNNLLSDCPVTLPFESEFARHVYYLYVIRTPERDELRAFLESKGISTGIHYPIPIHLQEAYASLGYRKGDFPVSEACAGEILSLPLFAELAEEQIDTVTMAVRDFYGLGKR